MMSFPLYFLVVPAREAVGDVRWVNSAFGTKVNKNIKEV